MTKKYLGAGRDPQTDQSFEQLFDVSSLPFIRGKWFYVDPTSGNAAYSGTSQQSAFASIATAYAACTSGAGDGICVLSAGTTSAGTTSYLETEITWSKHGITVVGISSGSRYSNRARISNKERTTGAITTLAFVDTDGVYTITDSASGFVTAGFSVGQVVDVTTTSGTNDGQYTIEAVAAGALTVTESVTDENAATAGSSSVVSYCADLITVSGNNNRFVNLQFGNFGSPDVAVGCVEVSGDRNAFENCHFIGAGNATPAATTSAYSLKINGGSENCWEKCVIGSDTIDMSAANGVISLDGGGARNAFYDCDILSFSSTAGHGAIISADATAWDRALVFARCRFINVKANGASALTAAFIGTNATSGYILMDSCSLFGWAAWTASSGSVYVANSDATASGVGGIATTV